METLKSLPPFEEVSNILEKVDFKTQEGPNSTKLELQDPEDLKAKLLNFGKEIYPKWQSANETNHECQDTGGNPGYQTFYITLDSKVVDDSVPISVVAHKKVVTGGELRTETLNFTLLKGDEPMSEISLFNNGDSFEVNHRDTRPQFRKQGFGTMLLKAGEEAVQAESTESQAEQQPFANVSQLDAIYWFWKNGYRPDSEEDWNNLNKILNGDSGLILTERYFIFDKTVPQEQRYYDVDGERQINFKNALRIKMKREIPFAPKVHSELQEIVDRTRSEAKG